MKIGKVPIIAITALVLIGVTLAVLSTGLLVTQQTISSNGNIASGVSSSVNIGVYSDAAATIEWTNINWGTLTPGNVANQTVYVKNLGNTPETLSMSTSGWSPASASTYLTLTWNQGGTVLPANSVVAATLTLTVAADTGNLTSFSFNIVISGSSSS